jgi:hypothetical protein
MVEAKATLTLEMARFGSLLLNAAIHGCQKAQALARVPQWVVNQMVPN